MQIKNISDIISIIKKKKGVIYIKKKIFFLILLLLCIFKTTEVYAATTFYDAECIGESIYVSKVNKSTHTTYYRRINFIKRRNDNQFVYCIEPFVFLDENSTYNTVSTPPNLTEQQLKKINLIAHYGYMYPGHELPRWYMVAQLLIWKVANPNDDFYFTETPNGTRVEMYKEVENEILRLVNNYDKRPNIKEVYYNIEDKELVINSPNIGKEFITKDSNITINENNITISELPVGEYEFTLIRDDRVYNSPPIYYQSSTSQNLTYPGDIDYYKMNFKVKIVRPTLEITKEDEETGKMPQGEASLDGTIITLYDEEENVIDEFEIKDNNVLISNLDFGKYYIEETTPGEGYNLNEEKYEITISEDNIDQQLTITNQVIKKEIKIKKEYGSENEFKTEENIEFEIYDKNNNLVDTIITDKNGEASITLPYGEYTFIQKNSTIGYNKVDNFIVKVEDNEDELIELKDYKIPVPNTKASLLKTIIYKIINLLLHVKTLI